MNGIMTTPIPTTTVTAVTLTTVITTITAHPITTTATAMVTTLVTEVMTPTMERTGMNTPTPAARAPAGTLTTHNPAATITMMGMKLITLPQKLLRILREVLMVLMNGLLPMVYFWHQTVRYQEMTSMLISSQ